MTPPPGAMPAATFRELGHRMVDWIADYLSAVETLPVRSRNRPGDLLRALPASPPEAGLGAGAAAWEPVFADLDRLILPGLTHWQSPSFFAYFPSNASGPAILGELLAAGLGVQGMLWATSPAATELEERMLEWLGEAIGLPPSFRGPTGGGCIQGTASEATLVALVAARERVRRHTRTPPDRLVAYASAEAHSSVAKATRIAGLDDNHGLRRIAVGADLAMRPDALAARIAADRDAGRQPFFVCATVGTTSTGAVDPLRAVAGELARLGFDRAGGWLHVDAAYAGAAAVCPEHRHLLDGIEHADSLCFNPHKALLVNFDCDAFWTRDRAALTTALGVTPAYLRNAATDSGAVVDYRDWQVPLGRRFRALKLWFVLRHYGLEGLRAHVRHHVALAADLERRVRADARFELAAPRCLGLVCFRLRGDAPDVERRNRELLERLHDDGAAFLSHTELPGPGGTKRFVLRMAIGATLTEARHVDAAWARIAALAGEP